MKKINIGVVVRIHDEAGNFEEVRYDHVSCENIPSDIMDDLMAGEVISVQLMPNAEAFYFKVPLDWPENWTELGTHTRK